MRFRRAIAATAVAVVAGGGALLLSTSTGSAATTPPTQVNLGLVNTLTGMSSASCPLPLNNKIALKPGTVVQFEPDALLSSLFVENVTITPNPEDPTSKTPKTISGLTTTNGKVTFARAGTYKLDWESVTLLGVLGLHQTGTLDANANAQQCVVGVNLPTPSVSVPGAGPINSLVNGVASGVVGGVNSAVAPVNSAVGPVLGGVNGAVGGLTGGGKAGGGTSSSSSTKPGLGTIYTPSNETGAQRTVPKGGDSGGGANSESIDGQSINAAEIPFKGLGGASGPNQSVKSGGSPKTIDLAANKPSSALDGWANLIVLAAVLALSGATAFYARTYLLHPLPAKVKNSA